MDLAKIRKKAKASPGQPEEAGAGKAATEQPSGQPEGGRPAPPSREERAQPSPPPAAASQETREPEPPTAPEAPAAKAAEGERLLIFDLAGEKYALPIHDIAQIIETPPTTPIPNAPTYLFGILSLRGKIVSVVDVAARLGIRRRTPGGQTKVVVLDLGPDQIGLLVDNIDQVVEVDLSSLEPPPEGFRPLAKDYVEGVFHHRGSAVAFLNLPMFLALEL